MDTEANVNSRLGEPEQVAEAAVLAHQHRSYSARHLFITILIFAISPLLFMLVAEVAVFMATAASLFGLGILDDNGSVIGRGSNGVWQYAIVLSITVIPAILLCTAYFFLAKRLRVGRKWVIASCTLVALIAGLTSFQIIFSDLPGESSLAIGLAIGLGVGKTAQLVQLIVPLLFGWWLIRRVPRHYQLATD